MILVLLLLMATNFLLGKQFKAGLFTVVGVVCLWAFVAKTVVALCSKNS